MLDCTLRQQSRSMCANFAEDLHVPLEELETVLDTWTAADFRAHCAGLTAAELVPRALRRGRPGGAPPTAGQA